MDRNGVYPFAVGFSVGIRVVHKHTHTHRAREFFAALIERRPVVFMIALVGRLRVYSDGASSSPSAPHSSKVGSMSSRRTAFIAVTWAYCSLSRRCA